jgi:hypothetical protein
MPELEINYLLFYCLVDKQTLKLDQQAQLADQQTLKSDLHYS